ncbi:MAG: sulfurtransferase [Pseudomonadota bacterium]
MAYKNSSGSKWRVSALVVVGVLALSGCDSSDVTLKPLPTTEERVAGLAQVSADDYAQNLNGLITGDTLSRWMANWPQDRPSGVTGRLVVLQVAKGDAGYEYPAHDGDGVRVFQVSGGDFGQTRSNGVINTPSMVPDGTKMDAFLKKYGIDPVNDLLVCSPGSSANLSNVMNAGRCWYALRYWGVRKENLAVLDGGNKQNVEAGLMAAASFAANPSTPPENGTLSVRALTDDNTVLLATLEDMVKLVKGQSVPKGGALLWDARGPAEYYGENFASSAGGVIKPKVPCAGKDGVPGTGDDKCYPAMEGSIGNAVMGQYTDLLRPDGRYKSKSELQSYVAGLGYRSGNIIYGYCRTSTRAMVSMVASALVLGLPTRIYDGASAQWNALANYQNVEGGFNLPVDSPWRTDSPLMTAHLNFNPSNTVEPVDVRNAYASHADAIVVSDRAYKLGK